MPEFSDYIESLSTAGSLDGTEIIGVSKGGAAVSITAAQIAGLAPGGSGQAYWRGAHDASGNTYPAAGTGSGVAGAIQAGDEYYLSVGGTLNGDVWNVDTILKAKVDTPGQTNSNWLIKG